MTWTRKGSVRLSGTARMQHSEMMWGCPEQVRLLRIAVGGIPR